MRTSKTSVSKARATKNEKTVSVRRLASFRPWFIPKTNLRGSEETFEYGVMRDVTFNPKAPLMKDVFCGTDRVSEAEVIGHLTRNVKDQPSDMRRSCRLDYDRVGKVFCNRDEPSEIIKHADYLILKEDGSSIVGWK